MEEGIGITEHHLIVGIVLILSHLITDFVLQPTKWVEKKREFGIRTKYFWYHVFLSAIIPYLLIFQWDLWVIPTILFITHAAIDYWKISEEKKIEEWNNISEKPKTRTHLFIIDQPLHIFVLIGLFCFFIIDLDVWDTLKQFWCAYRLNVLVLISAFIFLLTPSGILIGSLTEQFRKELQDNDSLRKAGMFIGAFERLLVFVFVLLGQYGGIGFLLASKSILRIARDGENEGRKKTEYVLIGTLISFSLAIGVGLIVKYLLNRL